MNYRFLGRTGLKANELCLGAMTFGRESTAEVSHQLLDRFVEAGGNFIDTADVYSQGVSEEILGWWLKGRRRDDFVIATKVCYVGASNFTGWQLQKTIDLGQQRGWEPPSLGASRAARWPTRDR